MPLVERRVLIVDGRQHADVETAVLAGEFGGGNWLRDTPRVDEPVRRGELLLAFQKERTSLGKEDRLTRIVGELRGIGLYLRKVGVGRA